MSLELVALRELFVVSRLGPGDEIPDWVRQSRWLSITRTMEELSIICEENSVPEGLVCERGFRGLKVQGPLPFTAIGILASLATTLARASIPLLAVSTYDTDYLFVRDEHMEAAIEALLAGGHSVARD